MDKEQKHRLISVLEEQMYRVEDLCVSEDLSSELKVHEIRKCFKRINALLRLFPDSIQQEVQTFRQPMKSMARRLTMARETTVNLQFFETMCAENQCLVLSEAQELKQQLAKENFECIQELVQGESIFDAIRSEMKIGRYEFLEKLPDNDFTIDVLSELDLSFHKSRNLYLNSCADYHPEEFHELRKQMKILWYQFEFIHPGQTEVPGTLSDRLHQITDRLGDDHDWYIFLNEIDHEKYVVSDSFKTSLEVTIQKYQKENLVILNESLANFFREKDNEFLHALRKV